MLLFCYVCIYLLYSVLDIPDIPDRFAIPDKPGKHKKAVNRFGLPLMFIRPKLSKMDQKMLLDATYLRNAHRQLRPERQLPFPESHK